MYPFVTVNSSQWRTVARTLDKGDGGNCFRGNYFALAGASQWRADEFLRRDVERLRVRRQDVDWCVTLSVFASDGALLGDVELLAIQRSIPSVSPSGFATDSSCGPRHAG